MDIDRGTEAAILEAMCGRLIDEVEGLNEGNCLVTDLEEPPQLLEDLVCTVSAGDGTFDGLLWAGGGINTLAEELAISVSLFARRQLDRNDHARSALLARDTGILSRYKPELLRALLVNADGTPWEPIYRHKQMLRDQLQPLDCTRPRPYSGTESPTYLIMTLRFRAYFDWQL